jgi:type III restriction enzyme
MAKRLARTQEPPANWKPTQAVPDPILNGPYDKPTRHWIYRDGIPQEANDRRPASYYYTSKKIGAGQQDLLAEEERDDLELVNRLRKDVERWRGVGYRGASAITRELLSYWSRPDRPRRMFFCQLEAAETLIYLMELGFPGRLGVSGYKTFELDAALLAELLSGDKPSFAATDDKNWPRLVDPTGKPHELPLRRLGCKMATGSGKTAVMAMIITWAFLNRARNPASMQFPNGVLICAPNLTVKERLQVLKPEHPWNSFEYFDLVPSKYRDLLGTGRILITNWHGFSPKSEHDEGGTSYRVVQKGEETSDAFTRDRLGELAARLPILVLNDEGHHCWRPNPAGLSADALSALTAEERKRLEEDKEEARVWLAGLDRINNSGLIGTDDAGRLRPGVLACIDLSATPFYLSNSGYPEGSPFPWLVSDFGLVDAIECGIVKIPRLPVADDKAGKDEAGRPDPKYFRLYRNIVKNELKTHEFIAKRPKPDAIYLHAEGALKMLAAQWKTRFDQMKQDADGGHFIPPVMIVVCDNVEIADLFYQRISGEHVEAVPDDSKEGVLVEKVIYGDSAVFPELQNESGAKRTVRIDTKLLAKIETEEGESKDEAAKALRELIATVGKRGGPGEQIRCVVSVSMLTEGWDANSVEFILGLRAFDSQLLCEQVVGRGLRRVSYNVDPTTGLLPPEYVDVYGIPFSLIPFKGKPKDDDGKPDPVYKRIFSVRERAAFEIRFPVVESYTYDVRDSGIQCNVDELPELQVKEEPTTVWLTPTRGYNDDPNPLVTGDFVPQTREEYYNTVRPQQVIFRIAQLIVEDLISGATGPNAEAAKAAKARGLARHQIFPEVVKILQKYITSGKVKFAPGVDVRELALERYANQVRERVRDGITAAVATKEHPLLPVTNRYEPYVTTDGVEDQTTWPIATLAKSHLNAAIVRSEDERKAIDVFEDLSSVECYTPNSRKIGMTIPYRFDNAPHRYEPDFVVRLRGGTMLIIEIKGLAGLVHGDHENRVEAKRLAAAKWVEAVNNTKANGQWAYIYCDRPADLRGQILAHAGAAETNVLPFRIVTPKAADRFVTCVPISSLRAAAGRFSEEQASLDEIAHWASEWVTWDNHPTFEPGMFVARVQGKSMEPEIPDGSYCLFRAPRDGSRDGRRLLVWHSGIDDPMTSGHYTLKVFTSEKAPTEDGSWHHTKIVLKPLNAEFEPLVLMPKDEGDVKVIAELVTVLIAADPLGGKQR